MRKGSIGVVSGILGVVTGVIGAFVLMKKGSSDCSKEDKFRSYYNLLNQWLDLKNRNISFEKYFVENDIKKVAIYGMGELGMHLYEELNNSCVEVVYGIDKDGENCVCTDIDVFTMDDELENVDAIVVTAVFAFDKIRENLEQKVNCPIIPLDDIVFGLD